MTIKNETSKKSGFKLPKESKIGDVASGGVVYYVNPETNNPETVKFLLLKHKGRKKHWDLPKGHLKKKENLIQCAFREVSEESGIPKNKLVLIQELEHKNVYTIKRHFSRRMKKVVHLFLFQSMTDTIKLSKEHTDFKWTKYDKLEKRLTYPNTSLPAFIEAYGIVQKRLNSKDNHNST